MLIIMRDMQHHIQHMTALSSMMTFTRIISLPSISGIQWIHHQSASNSAMTEITGSHHMPYLHEYPHCNMIRVYASWFVNRLLISPVSENSGITRHSINLYSYCIHCKHNSESSRIESNNRQF